MDKATLCALLGLSADVTDADLKKAIEQMRAAAAGADDLATKLSKAEEELKASKQAAETLKLGAGETQKLVAQLQADNTKLAGRVEAMESNHKQEQAKALADELLKDGCIYPVQVPSVMQMALAQGLDVTRKLFSAGPKIPLGERGVRGDDGQGTPEQAMTQLEAIAAELVTKKLATEANAMERAIAQHPQLALRAQAGR